MKDRISGPVSLGVVLWAAAALCAVTPIHGQNLTAVERLAGVLAERGAGDVPSQELAAVTAPVGSPRLSYVVSELTRVRSEARALQDRYSDDYPPIRSRLSVIASIETEAMPRVVEGLRDVAQARAELAVLRDRFSEDYPPIGELLAVIESIETEVIGGAVSEMVAELEALDRA